MQPCCLVTRGGAMPTDAISPCWGGNFPKPVDRKDETHPESDATNGIFERPRMVIMRVIPIREFPW